MTNEAIPAKKQVLDLIEAQMQELRLTRNSAMEKITNLRAKYLRSGDAELLLKINEAEADLSIIRHRSKNLEEAMTLVYSGFGN